MFALRRELLLLRNEFNSLREEFIKLAVLMQAFLMTAKFKNADQEIAMEKKSTDTQVMISRKELENLRDIKKTWERDTMNHIEEILRPNAAKIDKRKKDNDDDEGAIEFSGGGFR